MTREEYESLLKSDYWKGYSYSLIKERNFTCEDCGKQFPNERNKLQVHHLLYRDVKPWSYRPSEVVVLCEECHKKRHGIVDDSNQHAQDFQGERDNYFTSTSSTERTTLLSGDSKKWKIFNGKRNHTNSIYRYPQSRRRRFKFRYLLYAVLLLIVIVCVYNKYSEPMTEEGVSSYSEEKLDNTQSAGPKKNVKKTSRNNIRDDSSEMLSDQLSENPELDKTEGSGLHSQRESDLDLFSTSDISEENKSVEETGQMGRLDVKEESNLNDYAKDATSHPEEVKVNTEETTSNIQDRKNHKSSKKKNE